MQFLKSSCIRKTFSDTYRLVSNSVPELRIYEVGPRDGLQNESKFVPTDIKIELIHKLAAAGIKHIESASFVSPKWVKQMSDGKEVMTNLKRSPGVNYPVLIPNLKGYEAAKKCNIEEIAIFPAGSEGFSQKNLNCSVEEGLKRFKLVADQAVRDGVRVRGYISCVVGCPYEGSVSPKAIAKITEELFAMGCYEVSLGDTIGVGTAGSVRRLMQEVLAVTTPDKLALHFHDTYGQGLSNLVAGLEFGIKTVDSAISGLGGCPYAREASGNLATEDLVYFLYGLGVNTNVDLVKLVEAGRFISNFLAKPTDSKVNRAIGDKFKHHQDIIKMAACTI
ncbi:hydroxymethylglutaryl-CoA lyase, mitochondrial [Nymphalis io]|uniref:hydroxymethylglutaryl-CoA lyase, mitochondrial n=1 Tax=Inachis io TaxID=171585 RepID=UPI002168B2B4|nr:hydroxymethylglutaryl-CoA lyase, mitochondrial [Nymphalis io]XP_050361774.1 hydroxymethylglutaryl-CoA lyase, mitochondrial [Nymphalis io]